MKITINGTTYTKVKNLDFAPEADVTGSTLPIDEFRVDILTTDSIDVGQFASLYDDRNTLWAKYWITDRWMVGDWMRVVCQSPLLLLERKTMEGIMLSGATVSAVLTEVFRNVTNDYTIDSTTAAKTLTGWVPKQSARERLQWVCFAAGAYVSTAFTDKIEVKTVSQSASLIPIDQTFWKPQTEHGDTVTAIAVTAFSFVQQNPGTTDEYVTNGMEWYVVTRQTFTLANPNATAEDPENVVRVQDCMLVNQNNVGDIMSHLGTWYFNRVSVQADIINNATFTPGQRVTAYADENTLVTGYIDSLSFRFGLQARSTAHITAVEVTESGIVVINYMYGEAQIGMARYRFPAGYSYNIENPYVDFTAGNSRYIFRPLTDYTSGTATTGTVTHTVNYGVALHQHDDILHVVSVYGVSQSEGRVTIE